MLLMDGVVEFTCQMLKQKISPAKGCSDHERGVTQLIVNDLVLNL